MIQRNFFGTPLSYETTILLVLKRKRALDISRIVIQLAEHTDGDIVPAPHTFSNAIGDLLAKGFITKKMQTKKNKQSGFTPTISILTITPAGVKRLNKDVELIRLLIRKFK